MANGTNAPMNHGEEGKKTVVEYELGMEGTIIVSKHIIRFLRVVKSGAKFRLICEVGTKELQFQQRREIRAVVSNVLINNRATYIDSVVTGNDVIHFYHAPVSQVEEQVGG